MVTVSGGHTWFITPNFSRLFHWDWSNGELSSISEANSKDISAIDRYQPQQNKTHPSVKIV